MTENIENSPPEILVPEVSKLEEKEPQEQRWAYRKDGTFYGTVVSTEAEFEELLAQEGLVAGDEPPLTISREQVNAERDRRIEANFVFDGNPYQFDEMSKQRITGAATLAGFAIGKGAPEGYLRWADVDNDFVFISSDDLFIPMDAQKCFEFGQAAARHETAHIFAASAIKKVMPEDYEDDKYWPGT